MTDSRESSGHCLCGAVRFTAKRVSNAVGACHCGMCRRWASGPLFAVTTERVSFEGEDKIARYDSSEWAERGFCKLCGTNLFYFLKPTGQVIMSVGAFDDPAPFKLEGELFIDLKPEGYAFAGEHERLTEAEVFAKYIKPEEPA